jgi:transcriptional regulator with XRE-family HTH domain
MKISISLTDESIIAEIGRRIAARRLEPQLTQAEVAEQAGVAKRTLERIEAGQSAQISSIIRILRVLDGVSDLDRIIPEVSARPMELLQRKKGKVRQRASKPRQADDGEKSWTWND